MAQAIGTWGAMNPAEEKIKGFDFVNALAAGDTLSSGAWTCVLISGVDADPASHILDEAEISGSQILQRVGNFLVGCTYALSATVITTFGERLTLWAYQECVAIGAVDS